MMSCPTQKYVEKDPAFERVSTPPPRARGRS
jgi:hypothetical protein